MSMQILSFGGKSEDVLEAETVARAKVSFWLKRVRAGRDTVCQLAMQTIPVPKEDGMSWQHLITLIVDLDDLDFDYWLLLRERVKDIASIEAFAEELEDEQRTQRALAKMFLDPTPRTEDQEHNLVTQNNVRCERAGISGQFSYEEWKLLCVLFDSRCVACKGKPARLTIDHVIPVVRGGSNTIANIQPLCKRCNSRKHDKDTDYRDPELLRGFLETIKIGE